MVVLPAFACAVRATRPLTESVPPLLTARTRANSPTFTEEGLALLPLLRTWLVGVKEYVPKKPSTLSSVTVPAVPEPAGVTAVT